MSLHADPGSQPDPLNTTQPAGEATTDPASAADAAADRPHQAVCCGLLQNLVTLHSQQRYRLLREVARGGMAQVLEVWDANLGRRVAMKVSRVSVGDSPDLCLHQCEDRRISRFIGEAAVMCHLDHPGVVSVHEIGLDSERRLYFVMSLVKGETLESVIAKARGQTGGWNRARALAVVISICETLGYAHSRGVVHRDVKPANVMVGSHGRVYVMDWGVAHVTADELFRDGQDCMLSQGEAGLDAPIVTVLRHADRRTTPDGALLGTPCYMAVEQAEGRAAGRSSRVDIYAVGAILYQLLSGQAPYEEVRSGTSSLLSEMRRRSPTPLRRMAPDAPPELVAICEKAMAREPDQRYPDMESLARDLRAHLQHRTVKAFRDGWTGTLIKWSTRNPSSAAWCGAALTLACLLLGFALAAILRVG